MENYLEKAIPILDKAREIIRYGTDFLARAFDLPPENIYIFTLVVLSIYLSKSILELFYSTLEGRRTYHLVLAAIIFLAIKFLGV